MIYVLMGVCGCGKTTVGKVLSEKLNCCFRDADEFHSKENKTKMSQGIPLTDQDRIPWLKSIHEFIKVLYDNDETAVIACSALKNIYRTVLLTGEVTPTEASDMKNNAVLFVYLCGDVDVLEERINHRQGHFMPAVLLQSQLETLEEPTGQENALTVNIDQTVDSTVEDILSCSRH